LLKTIADKKEFDDDLQAKMKSACEEFMKMFAEEK